MTRIQPRARIANAGAHSSTAERGTHNPKVLGSNPSGPIGRRRGQEGRRRVNRCDGKVLPRCVGGLSRGSTQTGRRSRPARRMRRFRVRRLLSRAPAVERGRLVLSGGGYFVAPHEPVRVASVLLHAGPWEQGRRSVGGGNAASLERLLEGTCCARLGQGVASNPDRAGIPSPTRPPAAIGARRRQAAHSADGNRDSCRRGSLPRSRDRPRG